MSKVHFFPDFSYHEAKSLEEKYNATDQELLINKASDFICDIVSRSRSKNQKYLFICGPGSNGLDGIYCAHKLDSRGYEIEIFNTKKNSNIPFLENFNLRDKLVNNFRSQIAIRGLLNNDNMTQNLIKEADLIVNTTPVGMKTAKNKTNVLPFGKDFWRSINSKTTIYDLIYNPTPTPLLELGNKKGCMTINGLEMLLSLIHI